VRRAGLLAALPGLWLIGVIGLGSYVLARSLWLWQAVVSERPVTDQQVLDLLEDYKMQMRVKTIVGVVVTDRTGSPALFGIIRPRILLPQGLLETINLGELQYVFLHELAHLKRRDIYLAWLVCVLQVLHWFNPLIWLAFRRMRIDQELATDAWPFRPPERTSLVFTVRPSSISSNGSPDRSTCHRWPGFWRTPRTSKGE
jgi:bla regulator protein BlaR1